VAVCYPTSHWNQFLRFVLWGLLVNLAGFVIYLLMTHSGFSPQLTITLLYPIGLLASYLTNSVKVFQTQSSFGALFRFLAVQLFGYLTNLVLLTILVDEFQYPHQFVQFAAIGVVAMQNYILLKYWGFTERN